MHQRLLSSLCCSQDPGLAAPRSPSPGGTATGVEHRGGCPQSPLGSSPQPCPKPLSRDLIAFVHFMVDELQQEPCDVPQDESGDEVPVNHIPKTANAPVEGPGQGSARVRVQLGLSAQRPGRGSARHESMGLQQEPNSHRAGHGWSSHCQRPHGNPHACHWASPTLPPPAGCRPLERRWEGLGQGGGCCGGGQGASRAARLTAGPGKAGKPL